MKAKERKRESFHPDPHFPLPPSGDWALPPAGRGGLYPEDHKAQQPAFWILALLGQARGFQMGTLDSRPGRLGPCPTLIPGHTHTHPGGSPRPRPSATCLR